MSANELPAQLCRYADGSIHSGFVIWQKIYADHGLLTIPVGLNKKPLVQGWSKDGHATVTPERSAEWAQQFPFAPAVGVLLGAENGITALDIDTTDERVLADALDRHGQTPLIEQTARDRFKAWFKFNGERRFVRNVRNKNEPFPGLPIDLLGGGMAVAPPSFNADLKQYRHISGTLDDIGRLPVMRNLDPRLYRTAGKATQHRERADKANNDPVSPLRGMREGDGRNTALFEEIGKRAKAICAKGGTRDQLFEVAMNENRACAEPMAAEEVDSVVGRIWRYTVEGHNYFGQHGAFMADCEIDAMVDGDQDALLLLTLLRRHNGPTARFWITNSLHEILHWRVERLVAARNRLLERGHVRQVKPAWSRSPALYRWRGYMGTPK
jgi:hypothetical protein